VTSSPLPLAVRQPRQLRVADLPEPREGAVRLVEPGHPTTLPPHTTTVPTTLHLQLGRRPRPVEAAATARIRPILDAPGGGDGPDLPVRGQQQPRDQARPARLMARAEPGTGVAVEVTRGTTAGRASASPPRATCDRRRPGGTRPRRHVRPALRGTPWSRRRAATACSARTSPPVPAEIDDQLRRVREAHWVASTADISVGSSSVERRWVPTNAPLRNSTPVKPSVGAVKW